MAEKSLEERFERLEAVHEIQNVMGKYEFLLSAGMYPGIVALFAQRDPDTSVQICDWGQYKGIEGVRRCFTGLHVWLEGKRIGFMFEHDLTTRVIEVAGDGKTAKGVWMSPGHETTLDPKTGKVQPAWCWVKYGCDFIKEDGLWKIWHMTVFLTFYTPFDKSWAEGGGHPLSEIMPTIPSEVKPDGPSITRDLPYSPKTRREFLPAFPKPYETYDATVNWMDSQKP